MTGIHPQLAVRRRAEAVEFDKAAFGATERHRVENDDAEIVCRLDVDGAAFWVSEEAPAHGNHSPESLAAPPPRCRLGHVLDPDGHHWEIGRPTSSSSGTS